MIPEVAILNIIPGKSGEFEQAFAEAQQIISGMTGYVKHELQRCIENPDQYILLVNWKTLEDHTAGFRGSEGYLQWKALLHHFYDPFPKVERYNRVF
ncbi:antibiotic biosynthesis monooxygenase [Pedobacter sp. L105]|uniref:antibiotic biosynthesis monooxygenase family protein n=1 Tax=Pedobacter sp. L105 TaxID=1641871 RepID=UPI00131C5895|nr:antibiotic biosynthesis monooxygenase [Pedobacter sp. L105]